MMSVYNFIPVYKQKFRTETFSVYFLQKQFSEYRNPWPLLSTTVRFITQKSAHKSFPIYAVIAIYLVEMDIHREILITTPITDQMTVSIILILIAMVLISIW